MEERSLKAVENSWVKNKSSWQEKHGFQHDKETKVFCSHPALWTANHMLHEVYISLSCEMKTVQIFNPCKKREKNLPTRVCIFAILTQIFLVFTVLNVYPGKINSLK